MFGAAELLIRIMIRLGDPEPGEAAIDGWLLRGTAHDAGRFLALPQALPLPFRWVHALSYPLCRIQTPPQRALWWPLPAKCSQPVQTSLVEAQNTLASTAVTEVIMATIAQTEETSPVVAAGTPIPLRLNANPRFC